LQYTRRTQHSHFADYDPESNGAVSDHEDGSDASVDDNAGTEHYEAVGKSKLRKSGGVSLGADYRGARVTRDALEQDSEEDEADENEGDSGSEEYDDPDMIDLEADEAEASDSEIDSDDALAQSDEDRFHDFAFRGSSKPAEGKGKGKAANRAIAADFMSSDEEDDIADGASDSEEEDDDNSGEDDDFDDGLDALANGADDSDEEVSSPSDGDKASEAESEEDSPENSSSAKTMVAATEVEKGMAIQGQRKMYDGLLNLRIRLQKALVASNTIPALEDSPEPDSEPYLAAEEAAVKLLNTINNLKEDFGSSGPRTGDKRKRGITAGMSSGEIWEHLQADEAALAKFRHDRLNKWSRKVQTVNTRQPNGLSSRNSGSARNKSLTEVLEEQLLDPEGRLLKRTRVPRSCAPAQAAKRLAEDAAVYDDADFYQQLLKELVEQRTLDGGDAVAAGTMPSVVLTAAGKDVKVRKNVDRKASKGRKMRFTVHEKIQNFMAPEDRRTWEQGAIDRFFSTMFGQRMELDEDEESADDEDMEGLSTEAEGLRLFK
jgi:protein AATF/BFR2